MDAPRPTSDLPTGCANDPEFCQCPEHAPRPTSELAADVTDGPGRMDSKQRAALDALVARVTDLEAQAQRWKDYYTDAEEGREDAEAQVAALTTRIKELEEGQ